MALAYQTYTHYACLSGIFGITLPAVVGAGFLFHGLSQFNENNHLHSLEITEDGNLKVGVTVGSFASKTITTKAHHVSKVVASGSNPNGTISIARGYEVVGGQEVEFTTPLVISLPEGGIFDQEGFDWVTTKTTDSEVDKLQTDLVHQRAKRCAEKSNMNSILNQELQFNL